MFAAIRRALSFASTFAACITFHIGRARSFHPVSSNRVGIQDRTTAAGRGEGASPVLRRLALLVLLNALWRAARQLAG